MRLTTPSPQTTEVDMVPLIDIVSLLLMFLIIVGDTTRASNSVKMNLPRVDQAKNELKETKGRIVVQLDREKLFGRYVAKVENREYELVRNGANKALIDFLQDLVRTRVARGDFKLGDAGECDFPVKLRIPEDAPMLHVEKLVQTLAQAKLVNVHYAAQKLPQPKP